MRTRSRHVVVVLFDEVELLDVAAPLEVLSLAGRRWNFRPFKVETSAPSAGLVATRNQIRIEAVSAVAAASPAEILVVPGGYGARRLSGDSLLLEQLKRLGTNAELVAGIGWGVSLLANAGLIAGTRVAATADVAATFPDGSAVTADATQRIVLDERVLTAKASAGALDLALAIVTRTLGPKLAAMVSADLGLVPETAPERVELKY